MDREKEKIYEFDTEVADLNAEGLLKPQGYLKLFAKIAERHLTAHEVNVDETMKEGLAWVLVSLSVKIEKPIEKTQRLRARTWYSQQRGPYFRREVLVENQEGETLFKGSSFSVMMNLEKRKIHRQKDMPFLHFTPTEEFTMEAYPTYKNKLTLEEVENRFMRNSYIDFLGHVNNTRYGEFAYDIFNKEEVEDYRRVKVIRTYFQSELLNEDLCTMKKGRDEGNLHIQGQNNRTGKTAFHMVFEW